MFLSSTSVWLSHTICNTQKPTARIPHYEVFLWWVEVYSAAFRCGKGQCQFIGTYIKFSDWFTTFYACNERRTSLPQTEKWLVWPAGLVQYSGTAGVDLNLSIKLKCQRCHAAHTELKYVQIHVAECHRKDGKNILLIQHQILSHKHWWSQY